MTLSMVRYFHQCGFWFGVAGAVGAVLLAPRPAVAGACAGIGFADPISGIAVIDPATAGTSCIIVPNGTLSYDGMLSPAQVLGSSPGTTQYTYESSSENLVTDIDGIGRTTTYTYDGGRLSADSHNGTTTNYTYDGGRLVTVTDSQGHTTTYAYDAQGRLTSDTRDGLFTISYTYHSGLLQEADSAAITITFTYDSLGRLTTLVENGFTTSYTYDSRGLASDVQGSVTTTYTYDALDRIIDDTVNGNTTSYVYDSLNRVISSSDPAGVTDIVFTAVPEPSTAGLFFSSLGMLLLIGAARRRAAG